MIQFDSCEICGADQWASAYHGSIRDGAFGSLAEKAEVRRLRRLRRGAIGGGLLFTRVRLCHG
jgi:hypothetical protein